MSSQADTLEMIYIELQTLVSKYFPELQSSGGGYSGPQFRMYLHGESRYYRFTNYYYKGPLQFIHWTSLANLNSILSSGEIRMYNLINSSDEQEFNFAANKLGLDSGRSNWIKEHYFAFSFCKKEELNNRFLWGTYGKDFKGVAKEFSITDDLESWEKYLISNLHYNLPDGLQNYEMELNILKHKYEGISFDFEWWRVAGFHKTDKFKDEHEVRISAYYPFKNHEEFWKIGRTDFKIENGNNRIVKYIPLKLWIDFDTRHYPKELYDPGYIDSFKTDILKNPKIKIENIYFDENCGITNKELSHFTSSINDTLSFQYGYSADMHLNLFRRTDTKATTP